MATHAAHAVREHHARSAYIEYAEDVHALAVAVPKYTRTAGYQSAQESPTPGAEETTKGIA